MNSRGKPGDGSSTTSTLPSFRSLTQCDLASHEISFTVVLRAVRDHLTAHAPGTACGHRPDPADLTAAIAAGPRNRPGRQRTGPRTKKERKIQHTRNVSYTIDITESNLPRAA